jgi:hypothetical protein
MPELLGAIITAVVGLAGSGLLKVLEQTLLGERQREESPAPAVRKRFGAFSWAWYSALFVGVVTLVVVLLSGAPTTADIEKDAYKEFFSTSAQITAALIIALAIEASRQDDDEVTADKLEACLCVALGAVAALCGLLPGLPRGVYEAALMIVPPALAGGLIGVVAIAVSQRRRATEGSASGDSRIVMPTAGASVHEAAGHTPDAGNAPVPDG